MSNYQEVSVELALQSADNAVINGYLSWYPRCLVTLARELRETRQQLAEARKPDPLVTPAADSSHLGGAG